MTTPRARLPLFGTAHDKLEAVVSVIGSVLLTQTYVWLAEMLDTHTSTLEYWSLAFSFACVWLSRTENLFSMHTGIISSVYMGVFLLRVDLVGQGWIQFAYYVPVQLYGWWIWCRGGEGKTELPVSRLNPRSWIGYTTLFLLLWISTRIAFGLIYDSPRLIWWDTSIVSASIVAQSLMTLKKIESWIFWFFPVNVSSLILYVHTGLPAFALMYCVFMGNAAWGWAVWLRTYRFESR